MTIRFFFFFFLFFFVFSVFTVLMNIRSCSHGSYLQKSLQQPYLTPCHTCPKLDQKKKSIKVVLETKNALNWSLCFIKTIRMSTIVFAGLFTRLSVK